MTNIKRIQAVQDFKFAEPFQIGETTVNLGLGVVVFAQI